MGAVACVEDLRRSARERFEALPWPVRTDEEWRRTDPEAIPFSQVDLRPEEPGFRVGWEPLPPEATRAGVILTDLRTALERHPELVEENLSHAGKSAALAKFTALHEAQWSQGLFCHVPDGVRVELPLRAWCEAARGGALYPRVLVVLGRQAEATLIDERRGDRARVPADRRVGEGSAGSPPGRAAGADGAAALSSEMVELILRPGASLIYVHLQRWGGSMAEVFTQRAVLDRGAQFLNIHVGLGGALTKANIETALRGTDAKAELLGIFFGSGKQHLDFHTLQDHQAERTTSDLLYKAALKDQTESIYTGLIRIEKQAQKSNAYQANRTLLLSGGAKADSVPMLEILADDVRCTHGVAIGPVDPDQAFYLHSRGLSPAEAERLIVQGFFEQVLRRIPSPALQEQLDGEVVRRMEGARG